MKFNLFAMSVVLSLILTSVISAQDIIPLQNGIFPIQGENRQPVLMENHKGELFFISHQDGQFSVLKSVDGGAGFSAYEVDFKNHIFTAVDNPVYFNRVGIESYLFFAGETGSGDQGIYALGFNDDGDLEVDLSGRLDTIPELTGKIDFIDVRRDSSYGFSIFFSKNNTLCEIYISDFTDTHSSSILFSYQGSLDSFLTLRDPEGSGTAGYGTGIAREKEGSSELILWNSDNSRPLIVSSFEVNGAVDDFNSEMVFTRDKSGVFFYWFEGLNIHVYQFDAAVKQFDIALPGEIQGIVPVTGEKSLSFLVLYDQGGGTGAAFVDEFTSKVITGIEGDTLLGITLDNLFFIRDGYIDCIVSNISGTAIELKHLQIDPGRGEVTLLANPVRALDAGSMVYPLSPVDYIILQKGDLEGSAECARLSYSGSGFEEVYSEFIPEGAPLLGEELEIGFFHNTVILTGQNSSLLTGGDGSTYLPYPIHYISPVSQDKTLFRGNNAFIVLSKAGEGSNE